MLKNACLLAKIGFDTAENEPCKVCPLSLCGEQPECMDLSVKLAGSPPFLCRGLARPAGSATPPTAGLSTSASWLLAKKVSALSCVNKTRPESCSGPSTARREIEAGKGWHYKI